MRTENLPAESRLESPVFQIPFLLEPLSGSNVENEANYDYDDVNVDMVIEYGPKNERFIIQNHELASIIEATSILTPLVREINGELSLSLLGLQNLDWFIQQICPKISRNVEAKNLFILNRSYNKQEFAKIQTKEECEHITLNSSFFMRILFGIILKKFKIDEKTSLRTTTILIDLIKDSDNTGRVYFCYLIVSYMMVCNRYELTKTQNLEVEVRFSIQESVWLAEKIQDLVTSTRDQQVCIRYDQTTNREYVLLNTSQLGQMKIHYLETIQSQLCPTEHQQPTFFTDMWLIVMFSIESALVYIPVLTLAIFFWNLRRIFKRIDIEEKGHQRMELLGIEVPLRSWNKLAVVCIAVILVLMSSYEGTRIFNLLHGDDWELSQFVWHNWWGRVLLGATLIPSGFTALWYFKGNGRNLLS